MIVTDNNIHDALEYLAIDPHPLALARKDLTDAESRAKRAFAEAFLNAVGSVEERKQKAELDKRYIAAKDEEAKEVLAVERHRRRLAAAEMLIEVWRSENANARASEKVR